MDVNYNYPTTVVAKCLFLIPTQSITFSRVPSLRTKDRHVSDNELEISGLSRRQIVTGELSLMLLLLLMMLSLTSATDLYAVRDMMPNTHHRRRRDATAELSRVGVGGVYWAGGRGARTWQGINRDGVSADLEPRRNESRSRLRRRLVKNRLLM